MTTDHDHSGFEPPAGYTDPEGRTIDNDLLGRVVGAGFDGCRPCETVVMDQLVQDPTSTARLVELACVAVASLLGGLPRNMAHDAGGLSSPVFKRLARAGLNGRNGAVYDEAEQLTVEQRRAAADTALDTLVGQLGMTSSR